MNPTSILVQTGIAKLHQQNANIEYQLQILGGGDL